MNSWTWPQVTPAETTTTETIEYDSEGRVVKRTVVTTTKHSQRPPTPWTQVSYGRSSDGSHLA